MTNLNVAFCGLSKNCINTIDENIKQIVSMRNNYKEINISLFIVDSDSSDVTKEIISKYEKDNEFIVYRDLDDLEKNYNSRIERITLSRNLCLDELKLKKYKKGMKIKSKVLGIDPEKERIALGIKQLDKDPFEAVTSEKFKKGSVATCLIENVIDAGLEVKLENDILGFIKKPDLSREKEEQKPSRFKNYKINEKIKYFVIRRLMVFQNLVDKRKFFKKILKPNLIVSSNKTLFKIADEIWFLAGDKSTDYNYYTKRIILMNIYAITFSFFVFDNSKDLERTKKFLDKEISAVLKFGNLKNKLKKNIKF